MIVPARRSLLTATAVALVAASVAAGQSNRTWTGLAAPNKNWTTVGNWNTGVPVSGDTAFFNGPGNGNTTVSLGGTTRPIKNVTIDSASAAPYFLGELPGDKFIFDAGGAITVGSTVSTAHWFNAMIQTSGALTITNSSPSTGGLSLGGKIMVGNGGTLTVNHPSTSGKTQLIGGISDLAGQPGSLSLLATSLGAGNNNNFVFYGVNTYSGPTTIQVNTGSNGSIQIGNDHSFGTGTVTVNVISGAPAPQFSVLDGLHALANKFNLNSGLTFVGGNSLVFRGPITIINSAVGGTRTLTNSITTPGQGVFFGDTTGQSTITLGNPVANGGDGVGKTAIFSPSASAMTVINHVMQDPAAGGGAASGSVQYAGSAGGVTQINGLNTYTGATTLNGASTVQFSSDYNAGGPSGPFGLGTLVANNATNNILQPIGGNRTIANPISMVFGLTVANAAGDTSGLTLAGPITLPTSGRAITNNFTSSGGVLTLGSAASPSTITLPTLSGQTMTLAGTGKTIINDVIQNPAPAPSPAAAISITSVGTIAFNAQNTYTGDTTLNGAGTVIRLGASSNGLPGPAFTAGPFGTGTVIPNNVTPILQPFGADRTIANVIHMAQGFTTSNPTALEDPTGAHNLTLTGPITLGASGRSITNNFVPGVSLTLGAAASPSTISLSSALTIQGQTAGGGRTVINSAISGSGGFIVQNNARVEMNHANNSYAGFTTVGGTGNPTLLVFGAKTGSGGVTINSGATLGGTGSVAGPITNNGTIAPGASLGTLTATSNVAMGANSHLAIELNGTSADKLVVGGNFNLSNVDYLDVTSAGGGLSWVIATYTGTLTGTFNNITPGYTVNYGAGVNSQITLNLAASGVPGDFNNNGKVDAGDYIVWRKTNGTITPLPNDNGLGTPISNSHRNLWRSNFGKPPGSGGGAGLGDEMVPEPASIVLCFLAISALLGTRTRRGSERVLTP